VISRRVVDLIAPESNHQGAELPMLSVDRDVGALYIESVRTWTRQTKLAALRFLPLLLAFFAALRSFSRAVARSIGASGVAAIERQYTSSGTSRGQARARRATPGLA